MNFSKAFDTDFRYCLLAKMRKLGISGKKYSKIFLTDGTMKIKIGTIFLKHIILPLAFLRDHL